MSQRISLSDCAVEETEFRINNFLDIMGQPVWQPSPCIDVISYSDASSIGCAGFVVQLGMSLPVETGMVWIISRVQHIGSSRQ